MNEPMHRIATAALLQLIEQSGMDVATLAEGLDEGELCRSRLTRAEVAQRLQTLGRCVASVPGPVRAALPEIDWNGWHLVCQRLQSAQARDADEALWFAVHSLVPATLLWLRVHRQGQPGLFTMAPG